jgi:hypothetical protein
MVIMNNYSVYWSKTYTASGIVELEAPSLKDAEFAVSMDIGDYEGSMQYNPDLDMVEAYPITPKVPEKKSYPVSAAIRDRS